MTAPRRRGMGPSADYARLLYGELEPGQYGLPFQWAQDDVELANELDELAAESRRTQRRTRWRRALRRWFGLPTAERH